MCRLARLGIRVFEALRGLGYEGSYDAVRRYAKKWRVERGAATAEAYVPLSFAPGEAYQFDWSHEIVLINGTTVTVKVAHVRLCHSRMLFVRAYARVHKHPELIDRTIWSVFEAERAQLVPIGSSFDGFHVY
jgi:transposase